MAEHTMMRVGRIAGLFLATGVFALGAVPGTAHAQDTDARWLAFSGCWQPVGQAIGTGAPDALLCFEPHAGDAGVDMISIEDGEIVGRETVRADGRPRDANLEGCTGWERGDFSARPGRVFLSSEYVCDGGVTRTSTGLLSMVSSEEWVDVRVVTAGGESLTWVTRYRLARRSEAEATGLVDMAAGRGMAVRSARVAASGRPSVDDVIEATGYVDAEGVEAWLAERDAPLELDSGELVRMADAGVSEDVIDMAIAVSYPERFAVDREGERYGQGYGSYGGRPGYYGAPYGSLFYGTYGFGYGYGYGFGFGSGGRFFGPTIVRVDRGDTGSRVVNGQGYRRGQNAGATRSRATSTRGSSIGGSSRGSSRGTSTGRTARRRGGGS